MALLGSNMSNEVGLRLLLSPLGSNIVVRTACCSVGIVLPVYSTFKAIETKDRNEQQRWLVYWAAYGSFSVAEIFADKFISWFPLYYHMKFAFLVWLQLPSVNVWILELFFLLPAQVAKDAGSTFQCAQKATISIIFSYIEEKYISILFSVAIYSCAAKMGARQLYMNHMRPFLLRHQARLDQVVGFFYDEMGKFVSAHQAEFKFAKTVGTKIIVSVNQIVRDIIHPVQRPANGMIEAPPRPEETFDSDHEE